MESFTESIGGIEDSSYIAALQCTLASRAECLILVGGGMFQELTMKKYMSTHEKANWCIHCGEYLTSMLAELRSDFLPSDPLPHIE